MKNNNLDGPVETNENSALYQKDSTFPYISVYKKLKFFLGAWVFSEIILITPLLTFIDRLNEKKILFLGEDFSSWHMFWGQQILPNILKLAIITVFAGIFGIVFGYKAKYLSIGDKLIYSIFNSVLAVTAMTWFFIGLLFILRPPEKAEVSGIFSTIAQTFSTYPFNLFFILQLVFGFVSGFIFISVGEKKGQDPDVYFGQTREKSDTLFGIKWYHYLWLWVPIHAYGVALLSAVYIGFAALINFVRSVKWFEFLGISKGSENSLDLFRGKLIWVVWAGVIAIVALSFLRKVLASERKMATGLRILVCIALGLFVPALLVLFVNI